LVVFGGVKTAVGDVQYSFNTIDFPGARFPGTIASGINDGGQIVGAYSDGLMAHGFLDITGSFTTIDVPGAIDTVAKGINDNGQIVGFYDDSTGEHGFLATPVPEPRTLPVLAGCLIGLFAMACRKRV